jgi:nucleoside-diphosphate-sugar epimerase
MGYMEEQKRNFVGTKIVLVGGGGFLGHHLALDLHSAGASVVVVDSFQVNNLLSLITDIQAEFFDERIQCILERVYLLKDAQIPIVLKDARDYHAICDVFADYKPNVVVHLASVPYTDRANKDSFSTFDHSLRTLENSLDASRYYADHFIYVSSNLVYGDVNNDLVTEEIQCNPLGVHGSLNFACERLIISYKSDYQLPFTIVRSSSLYGERSVGNDICYKLVSTAARKRQMVTSQKAVVELTSVHDLIQGISLIINNEKAFNEIFNISSGLLTPVSQIAELIKARIPEATISEGSLKFQEQFSKPLIIDKAREVLRYQPNFSLTEGLSCYVDWYVKMVSRSECLASLCKNLV